MAGRWKVGFLLPLLGALVLGDPYEFSDCSPPQLTGEDENVFEFKTKKLTEDEDIEFSVYKNKVMMIVNVASF